MTDIGNFLQRAGLGTPIRMEPLTGGVSSDIWRVELPQRLVCVKRALPRLRVAQLWEAPIERNRYEREWLQIAQRAAPSSAPQVLAWDDAAGLFAMEYLALPVWKSLLRDGRADREFSSAVGARLAAIHASTGGDRAIAERFATDAIFYAIRLEPYLVASAARHPDLKAHLLGLVERTASMKVCLVHGDVSPKNILVSPGGPVFLDAECAWYGDPAFDLAFCLNHLLLKCVWVPGARDAFLACFEALARTYLGKNPEPESRTATLLPALLLARVDGKSPVEYLDAAGQEFVRSTARALIQRGEKTLEGVRKAWRASLT